MFSKKLACSTIGAVLACSGGAAFADTIDPTSFEATLGVGDSVTIRKTVVIEETTTDALIDVMFVFDLTGSMGDEIVAARDAATDIMTGLSGFGDLQTGTGWYTDIEPGVPTGHDGVHIDLNSANTSVGSGIDDMWEGYTGVEPFATPPWCSVNGTAVGCGGDFAELGYAGIRDAAEDATWRDGSNRFIIVLGDASFKTGPDLLDNEAGTLAALSANDINLIGLSFGSAFSTSMAGLLADVYASSADPADIVADILAGVTASFQEYTTVSIDDFGAGDPEIDVSVSCVTAAIGGSCIGDSAVADVVDGYDRSVARTFEFDVTFTRTGAGDKSFVTCATVDGACVAREADRFPDGGPSEVPLPAGVWLLIGGLGGLAAMKRRAI